MKLCRFQPRVVSVDKVGSTAHPEILCGIVTGDSVQEIAGDIVDCLGERRVTGKSWPLTDIRLLPPVSPSKIVCVGRNYADHAAEFNNVPPKQPLIFLKPPSSVVAPEEPIVLPPSSQRVDYEGELAFVISKTCSYLSDAEDPRAYIAGYMCLNDVTARDLQASDKQWTRAKSFDTFCPMGPVLETEFEPAASQIETLVNGARKQFSPLSSMVFPVDVILRWVSRVMTLLPGDVIATGTPSGVGPLLPGDVVEVVIAGIGTLQNPVVARSTSSA